MMPLDLHWPQIALRIALALLFSFFIGLNRDERGHPAGIRTTMLVCLAATLAQLQANLLLSTAGKTASSFTVLDLERLPLGILSGIGFIGAGVIMKRDHNAVSGVTTAATIWIVTVLGLLFGGGQLWLGTAGGLTTFAILWALKRVEGLFRRRHSAKVQVIFREAPNEDGFRKALKEAGCTIKQWKPTYRSSAGLTMLECQVSWEEQANREPHTPKKILGLADDYGVDSITWDE